MLSANYKSEMPTDICAPIHCFKTL